MNIGIIGTGSLAARLGRVWVNNGHAVFFGSRAEERARMLGESLGAMSSGGTIAQVVEFASVILLAVPTELIESVLKAAGTLQGKILIDCTSPATTDWWGLTTGFASLRPDRVAALAAGARIVRVLNFQRAPYEYSGRQTFPQPGLMHCCGDDSNAMDIVAALLEDAGFDTLDVGPVQHMLPLNAC